MDAATIEKIRELSKPEIITAMLPGADGELTETLFTDRKMNQLLPYEPKPEAVIVSTITGFIQMVKLCDKTEHGYFIHVENPKRITVKSEVFGVNLQRAIPVIAVFQARERGDLANWMDQETAIVEIVRRFRETEDRTDLIRAISKIKSGGTVEEMDDGIGQSVSQTAGVVLVEKKALKPFIKLEPYRTFPDVKQAPVSFMLRVKTDNGRSSIRLIETDDGEWEARTMESIRDVLTEALTEWVIIA